MGRSEPSDMKIDKRRKIGSFLLFDECTTIVQIVRTV